MKHILTLLTLHVSLFALHSSAGIPQKWDVDLAAQPPQVFSLQRPRGETYELEAVLKDHGKPFAPALANARIYWQTNGMENLYWSAPASVSNNVLRATWLPSMDPGATTVRGYIGDPGHIYAAAFQFRFIASPGATPNELPLPQKVIDFAKVTVLNPPWSGGGGGGGTNTNDVKAIVNAEVGGTNAVKSAVAAIPGLQSSVSSLESSKRDYTNLTYNVQTPDEDVLWSEYNAGTIFPKFKWKPSAGKWVCWNESYDPADTVPEWDDDEYIERTPTGFRLVTLGPVFTWGNSFSPGEVGSDFGPDVTATITSNGHIVNDSIALANGVNAALANKLEKPGATSGLAKFGADGELVAATPGTDYLNRNEYGIIDGGLSTNGDIDTPNDIKHRAQPVVYSINGQHGDVTIDIPTTVRTYDSVRHCWWVLEMVNGVPTWTVED